MREEIEAAALFITRLVNKNLSSAACSSASSTHSSSSSSSSSSTSSESPPGFDEQVTTTIGNSAGADMDKVEQFRQCLMKALYERFHNHWFPEQPTKGQAYRCIRLNEMDRHDITLQQACLQCGIDYKDLQLPVELTLWVDPDEVTCRFGENKGSHCLVAKFKDGELKDNNIDLDINNINIEIFRQTAAEKLRQQTLHSSPDNNKQHNQQQALNNNNNNNIDHNSGFQFIQQNNHHHHHNHNHNHQQQHQHHQQPHHHHHHHQTQQHHHHQHQVTPPQHHQQKAAILPSYHNNYLNDNPIYYYF